MTWLCSITLADKSAKDKPPSVVGFSRLTLLDCLTTWVYLDNTRTRMRVLFYMVICASVFAENWGRFQSPLTPFAWGRNSCVRSLRSRVWACFDYQNNSQHIHTAPLAQHLLLQMHSMSITPECYSGILVKNTPSFRKGLWVGYICRFLRFLFSLFSLYLPLFYREKSGRRPREQRHNSPPPKSD